MKKPYKGICRIECSAKKCRKNQKKDVVSSCLGCAKSEIIILDLKDNEVNRVNFMEKE